ncbi:MAG: phosphohydrolase [Lachnospiraceae bacterium]|nr:phosphohydrolase [Lachnospiraceae bacterium]
MQFKRINELKDGMRLARPIYNKNGVLLFERDSKITSAGIASIQNFGLIGLFILEPAEPCPPMTPEDIEFERFQTVNVFSLMEEIAQIRTSHRITKLPVITANVIKSYGHLDKKINFIQSLRSAEDGPFKHALNMAILCAMIANKRNLKVDERTDLVMAALIHHLIDPQIVERIFTSNPNIKRYCFQADTINDSAENGSSTGSVKLMEPGKILAVANVFDNMTAMKDGGTPESEVATVKYLLENDQFFDHDIVMALVNSINILVPGVCVELNTGEKALILNENEKNLFEPMVLGFNHNEIIDLSNHTMNGDVKIIDIMKTLDNRNIIDHDMLAKYGMA